MSTKPTELKNVEASVRGRLANVAKAQGADFGFILRLYFLERFLYRLSASRYRESFLLKGALLFFARADDATRPFTRPTKDIDLEALAMQPRTSEPLGRRTQATSTPRCTRALPGCDGADPGIHRGALSRCSRRTTVQWALGPGDTSMAMT